MRIKLEMSSQDIFKVMSEGNPGALKVLLEIVVEGDSIDKDIPFPLMIVLTLDSMGIYGSDIWMLYKDVAHENLSWMLAIIRAGQTGLVKREVIKHAMANRGEGLDIKDTCKKVQERLPNFVITKK